MACSYAESDETRHAHNRFVDSMLARGGRQTSQSEMLTNDEKNHAVGKLGRPADLPRPPLATLRKCVVGASIKSHSVAVILTRALVAASAAFAAMGCTPMEISGPSTAPVASVMVDPAADNLLAGDSQQLMASPRDEKGRPVSRREISWTSLNPEIAAISLTGIVTGL